MGLVTRFLRRVVFSRKRAAADRIAAVDFEEGRMIIIKLSSSNDDDVKQKLSMDFSRVIGYGGFSTVYLARFSGVLAAVKRYSGGHRLYQVYKQELDILKLLDHRHIVNLLAYCDVGDDQEEKEGVLILEYIPNGNLQEKLHGPTKTSSSSLPWKRRMALAFQLGQAVSYLHDMRVVHGDIKPSNILLNSALDCKLCDFGSAKMGSPAAPPDSDSPRLSRNNRKLMMGSPGYTDPAYIKTGLVSEKNDVYALGVVILELITGVEAIDRESGEKLTVRVEPMMRDMEKVVEMVDRRLNGEFDSEEARAMVRLAAKCVSGSVSMRPNAYDIVEVMRSRVCGSLSLSSIGVNRKILFVYFGVVR